MGFNGFIGFNGFRFALLIALFAQWPEFRGPGGTATSTNAGLPLTWSEQQHVRWKTAIHGRAWSSPVVWGRQVWVTTATADGKELFAVALDRDTGRILHDLKLFDVPRPQAAHSFNSYASPTPVIEEGRVYVTFGSPGTAAIETSTGRVLWQRRDLECNHFRGAGSSPILFRNLLLMHFDGSDVQYVVALDKQTGRTVWRTNRSIDYQDLEADGRIKGDGDFRKAFSTPLIVQTGGGPVMVSIGSKAAYGYDPMTGQELWRIVEREQFSGSTRPVFGLGLVFYPTGFNTGQIFAVRPDGRGDVTSTHIVWRAARGAPNKPSILLAGDLLFMVNDGGIATCLDARTGSEVWRSRLGDSYSASPVSADGRVYFFSEDGKTTVIEAGRTFRILAENHLDDGFMASPAIDGRAFYLRTRTALYRIEDR
ncbi:MAG TPA: PQQ-binding-like beta-propeller repeat protein [Vicinamibacterales bacterium]|jgi:outer membrane protein assembly factor BamB|nr:PQQ-binding-like beta-propeller repeat protein [Vicinamibacterales bacterium]